MSGIVTVTASAAVDQTYLLPRLRVGKVNRAVSAHRELSGKGLNVARAAALAGTTVSAVVAVGDRERQTASELEFSHILHLIPTPGHTRINTTIVGENGRTTKVNEQPIPVSRDQWAAICEAAVAEIDRLDADWLVLCGRVPPSADSNELVSFDPLLHAARSRRVRVAVDTSGPTLQHLVRDLSGIALIKPNTHELGHAVGRALHTVGDVIAAAQTLRERGCEIVFVSMGADGAIAVSDDGVWWARARARNIVNATGAGDASLAGFIVHASGERGPDGRPRLDVPAGLAAAASWGALSVSLPTTLLSTLKDAPIPELVESPDPLLPLTDPAPETVQRIRTPNAATSDADQP